MLIQKTLKTIPWLNKGLFHSLKIKMHLLPLWVFLQAEMTDFPTLSYTLQRQQSVVKRGVGGGGSCSTQPYAYPYSRAPALLKFSKMPLALIVGTSNLVDPPAPTPPPVLQLVKSLPFRA